MRKALLLLLHVLALSACSPQYETRYELIPPTHAAGLVCLNACEAKARSCNQQCSQQQEQCSNRAAQQAALELPERLKEYDTKLAEWQQAMARYETDLRFYEMELRQRELQEDLRRLTCQRDGKNSASCLDHHNRLHTLPLLAAPQRPENAPEKPTLSSETARIRTQTCTQDCSCEAQYRQCYSSCGGTVKPYQFCVENCPSSAK